MKQWKASARRCQWNSSPVATLLFLLVAAAVLYGCTLLVRNVARNSLREDSRQAQSPPATTVSPAPSAAPDDTAFSVSAIRTPAASPTASPTPFPVESPTPDEPQSAVTPAPSPAPTLLPLMTAAPMDSGGANLLFIAMDERSRPDWIVAVRIAGEACDILSFPKNTLRENGTQLSDAGSAKTCAATLKYIWPVEYPVAITVRLAGLTTFVDELGGVTIGGQALDGAKAKEYLTTGPTDELLRIERQQAFMRAYLDKLRTVGLLTLLKSRLALEQYMDSNLGIAASIQLLELARAIDIDRLALHTLPVDSDMLDGARCYAPDIPRVNKMASEWAD